MRPVEQFASPDYTYKFICDQVIEKKNITPVYKLIDERTKYDSAPTKIPAGAIELNTASLGKVTNVKLNLASAVCTIEWERGVKARIFVPANEKGGRFQFENLSDTLPVRLVTPLYEENGEVLDLSLIHILEPAVVILQFGIQQFYFIFPFALVLVRNETDSEY